MSGHACTESSTSMARREEKVEFRVNKEELRALRLESKRQRSTLSQWIRREMLNLAYRTNQHRNGGQ